MDYLAHASELIKQTPHHRIIRGHADGQVFWIKQAVESKCNAWHRVQKILCSAVRSPLLTVTVVTDGVQALRVEADRYRYFKSQGISVPDVLAESHGVLVLSDNGLCLPECLKRTDDAAEKTLLMHHAAVALARLHKQNIVHGRPYLRDMTWKDDEIGFLDLEEDTSKVMPFPDAQSRDIWIFLCSVARYARMPHDVRDYDTDMVVGVYNAYLTELGATPPRPLLTTAKRLKPVATFFRKCMWHRKSLGKDIRYAVIATECVNGVEK